MADNNGGDRTVHLVPSWAYLLSGDLGDCRNATDPTCEGGVAAVSVMLRHAAFDNATNRTEPSLVLARADKIHPFVQMHELGWSVNRLVFEHLMKWNVFVSTPSMLYQNKKDFEVSQRDISDLQSSSMPLLLTNVAVPPANSWHKFVIPVHFDEATGLAVLSFADDGQVYNTPQIETAKGVLDMVAKVNQESGCTPDTSAYSKFVTRNETTTEAGQQRQRQQGQQRRCWIPVLFFADIEEHFKLLVDALAEYENAPAIILDIEANAPEYSTPRRIGSEGIWVASYEMDADQFFHHRITIAPDNRTVTDVTLMFKDLTMNMTDEHRNDPQYASDIEYLAMLGDQAQANNPVVGISREMPYTRLGTYRGCKAGECSIGNLFTDAMRWWTGSDVSFVTSGGLRGMGWAEGEVKVSDLWAALPFPNTECTGKMTGLSLFKLFNYSTSVATFQGEDTKGGGKLLQVSGMKVTYNTQMNYTRLIKLEVWDDEESSYKPLERLKVYSFATDSYLCGGYKPYPTLLGSHLVLEGEQPGVIGSTLHQSIVADYLQHLMKRDIKYDTSKERARLVNDTTASVALNWIQTEASCIPGSYWDGAKQSCLECSKGGNNVGFSDEKLEFVGVSGRNTTSRGRIVLVNRELFPVAVVPKSIPSWVQFTSLVSNATVSKVDDSFQTGGGSNRATSLESGESIALEFLVHAGLLEAGTAVGTVSFGVLDGGGGGGGADHHRPACAGRDATFEVFTRVTPAEQLNQLYWFRTIGWALAAVVVCTALGFAAWVKCNEKLRIVKTLQPFFLITICVGIVIMSLAIIPMGIDDGIASIRGCDIACMATPWLLSFGFTITLSALFSKLWRINRLFHQARFRRVVVSATDVLAPFAILATSNVAFLLAWTLADPLRWERKEVVAGEQWNTYGACVSEGVVGDTMMGLTIAVNFGALLLACHQAYRARKISDEFSESKNLAVAIFSWVQLAAVGIPVLFLIDADNPTAKYFLQTALLFAVGMSVLLIIFVPMLLHVRKHKRGLRASGSGDANKSKVHVTGIGGVVPTTEASTSRRSTRTVGSSGRNVHVPGISNLSDTPTTLNSIAENPEDGALLDQLRRSILRLGHHQQQGAAAQPSLDQHQGAGLTAAEEGVVSKLAAPAPDDLLLHCSDESDHTGTSSSVANIETSAILAEVLNEGDLLPHGDDDAEQCSSPRPQQQRATEREGTTPAASNRPSDETLRIMLQLGSAEHSESTSSFAASEASFQNEGFATNSSRRISGLKGRKRELEHSVSWTGGGGGSLADDNIPSEELRPTSLVRRIT